MHTEALFVVFNQCIITKSCSGPTWMSWLISTIIILIVIILIFTARFFLLFINIYSCTVAFSVWSKFLLRSVLSGGFFLPLGSLFFPFSSFFYFLLAASSFLLADSPFFFSVKSAFFLAVSSFSFLSALWQPSLLPSLLFLLFFFSFHSKIIWAHSLLVKILAPVTQFELEGLLCFTGQYWTKYSLMYFKLLSFSGAEGATVACDGFTEFCASPKCLSLWDYLPLETLHHL